MGMTNTNSDSTTKRPVDADIQIAASRAVRQWLNSCHDRPCRIGMEYLPDDYGLSLVASETPYKLKSYINGGYLAACEYDLVYRCTPVTDDERLAADEILNSIANWAVKNASSLTIEGARIKRVTRLAPALLTARYSNGAEDHSVHVTIIFEVI